MSRKSAYGCAAAALSLMAALQLGGCGAQPRESGVRLLGTSCSPLSMHEDVAVLPAAPAQTSAKVVEFLPMLAATCSPAFRMIRVESVESDEETLVSTDYATTAQWEPLPMMMATSSPVFLRRTRMISVDRVAADHKAPLPEVIQTDAD